ncbi:MAG: FliM/FliN family flagellar motor switch protein [Janthinobacterium lividum]
MTALSTPLASASTAPRLWFDRDAAPSLTARIPLFGEAMDKVARAWTEGFAALTATPVTFAFVGLTETRNAGLAHRRGRDPVFAVLQASAWGTPVGLQFDRAFVASVVEAMFGGDDDGLDDAETGALTAVERRIAEVIALQAADALTAGFVDVLPSTFAVDRIQPKPDLAFLGRPNAAVLVATLSLKALGRVAEIDMLVARAALDGFVDRLALLPADEPQNTDPRWSERLEKQVSHAPMTLSALIEAEPMTLGTLAALQVGQMLALPRNAATDIRLVCEGRELFRCDLGRSAGHYTVRVDEPMRPTALPEE